MIVIRRIIPFLSRFLVDDLRMSYKRLEDCVTVDMKEIEEEAELTDAEGERNRKLNELEASESERSQENSDVESSITYNEAHCNVIFDLTVIAEIVTYKSSVVGVSNFLPSFSFLF